MNARPFRYCLALLPLLAAGCGGSSSSGGPSTGSAPTVSLVAEGPEGFNSTGGAKGFDDSGRAVYATADTGTSNWTVYVAKGQPLYHVTPTGTVGGPGNGPKGITGRYVVGEYSDTSGKQGLLVAWKNGDGTVSSARYEGYRYAACDGGKAIVSKEDSLDSPPSFFLMDLSDGSVTQESIPGNAIVTGFKGRFVLFDVWGGGSASVYDTSSNTTTPLQKAAGTDATGEALAVNAAGQTLGVTKAGTTEQLRVWSAAGVPGEVIDTSAVGGELFMGWISADGTRMTYKKGTESSETQFVRVDGTSYALPSSLRYTSLNGLNDDGTLGFAADLSSDESTVTVGLSYK